MGKYGQHCQIHTGYLVHPLFFICRTSVTFKTTRCPVSGEVFTLPAFLVATETNYYPFSCRQQSAGETLKMCFPNKKGWMWLSQGFSVTHSFPGTNLIPGTARISLTIQHTKVSQLRTAKQKDSAQHRKLAEPMLETTFLWTSSEMRKINPGYWSLCFVYIPLCAAEHSPNWCLFPQALRWDLFLHAAESVSILPSIS